MTGKIATKEGVTYIARTFEDARFGVMAAVAQAVAPDAYSVTVTSAGEGYSGDGVHRDESCHYIGWAIDVRIRDFPGTKYSFQGPELEKCWEIIKGEIELKAWVRKIAAKLGSRYTVILEVKKLHIHMQFNG